jgi:hypothetical protein
MDGMLQNSYRTIRARRISGSLGAEITGVNLAPSGIAGAFGHLFPRSGYDA